MTDRLQAENDALRAQIERLERERVQAPARPAPPQDGDLIDGFVMCTNPDCPQHEQPRMTKLLLTIFYREEPPPLGRQEIHRSSVPADEADNLCTGCGKANWFGQDRPAKWVLPAGGAPGSGRRVEIHA